ncbi:MAG: helix-turn-helix domain-containing protein, partial [Clostridia bacterium]
SAYLDNNRNASAAAKQLFVHRNTLIERLRHIEAMLDVSLDDAEVCLYLQISLRIRTLVNL